MFLGVLDQLNLQLVHMKRSCVVCTVELHSYYVLKSRSENCRMVPILRIVSVLCIVDSYCRLQTLTICVLQDCTRTVYCRLLLQTRTICVLQDCTSTVYCRLILQAVDSYDLCTIGLYPYCVLQTFTVDSYDLCTIGLYQYCVLQTRTVGCRLVRSVYCRIVPFLCILDLNCRQQTHTLCVYNVEMH